MNEELVSQDYETIYKQKLDLQENMYVRTKYGISQYKYYDTTNGKLLCIPVKDGSRGIFANIEDIIKASFNIIDILKCGDYVNGHEVKSKQSGVKRIDIGEDENYVWLTNKDIKSIVTHEQMEQMSYKLGE